MRWAKIRTEDIANGPGFRVSIYVQGCNNHCPGCFNPETWDFKGGKEFTDATIDRIRDTMYGYKAISGISDLIAKGINSVDEISEIVDELLESKRK